MESEIMTQDLVLWLIRALREAGDIEDNRDIRSAISRLRTFHAIDYIPREEDFQVIGNHYPENSSIARFWNGRWGVFLNKAKLPEHIIEAFLEHFRQPDFRRRFEAAQDQAATGDKAAVPVLIEALNDNDVTVRKAAATTLGALQRPDLIELLLDLKGELSEGVMGARIHAVSEMGEKAFPELKRLIHERNSDSASTAIICLEWMGEISVPVLIGTMSHPNKELREFAIQSLELIGTPEALVAIDQWRQTQGE
jgi:hypothetical protein